MLLEEVVEKREVYRLSIFLRFRCDLIDHQHSALSLARDSFEEQKLSLQLLCVGVQSLYCWEAVKDYQSHVDALQLLQG